MGLDDGLKPTFRIEANAKDITELIRDRFISMKIVDESGFQSDSVEIILADHNPHSRIKMPSTGAELRVWLGYDALSKDMGLWIVDEVRISGPPDSLTFVGRSAAFEQTKTGKLMMTTHKTRTWPKGTKLTDMVKKIASEHGFKPAVSQSLARVVLPYIAQVNESDMNLLMRVVRNYYAIVKPAGGKLVVMSVLESKLSSTNADIPPVTLRPEDVTTYQTNVKNRVRYGKVIALYRDIREAKDKELSIGSKEPILRLKYPYPNENAAYEAAKAEYIKGNQDLQEIQLTLPGKTTLFAERRVILAGFREGIAGEWKIKRVEHTLDQGGYTTTLTVSVNITQKDISIIENDEEDEDE